MRAVAIDRYGGPEVLQYREAEPPRLRAGKVLARRGGGYAERVAIPAALVALKPARMHFEEAAGIPLAGLTAFQSLRDRGNFARGQPVLVNGAAGRVGTFAVQIAKACEATVTGVCSAGSSELVRDLGSTCDKLWVKLDMVPSCKRLTA